MKLSYNCVTQLMHNIVQYFVAYIYGVSPSSRMCAYMTLKHRGVQPLIFTPMSLWLVFFGILHY